MAQRPPSQNLYIQQNNIYVQPIAVSIPIPGVVGICQAPPTSTIASYNDVGPPGVGPPGVGQQIAPLPLSISNSIASPQVPSTPFQMPSTPFQMPSTPFQMPSPLSGSIAHPHIPTRPFLPFPAHLAGFGLPLGTFPLGFLPAPSASFLPPVASVTNISSESSTNHTLANAPPTQPQKSTSSIYRFFNDLTGEADNAPPHEKVEASQSKDSVQTEESQDPAPPGDDNTTPKIVEIESEFTADSQFGDLVTKAAMKSTSVTSDSQTVDQNANVAMTTKTSSTTTMTPSSTTSAPTSPSSLNSTTTKTTSTAISKSLSPKKTTNRTAAPKSATPLIKSSSHSIKFCKKIKESTTVVKDSSKTSLNSISVEDLQPAEKDKISTVSTSRHSPTHNHYLRNSPSQIRYRPPSPTPMSLKANNGTLSSSIYYDSPTSDSTPTNSPINRSTSRRSSDRSPTHRSNSHHSTYYNYKSQQSPPSDNFSRRSPWDHPPSRRSPSGHSPSGDILSRRSPSRRSHSRRSPSRRSSSRSPFRYSRETQIRGSHSRLSPQGSIRHAFAVIKQRRKKDSNRRKDSPSHRRYRRSSPDISPLPSSHRRPSVSKGDAGRSSSSQELESGELVSSQGHSPSPSPGSSWRRKRPRTRETSPVSSSESVSNFQWRRRRHGGRGYVSPSSPNRYPPRRMDHYRTSRRSSNDSFYDYKTGHWRPQRERANYSSESEEESLRRRLSGEQKTEPKSMENLQVTLVTKMASQPSTITVESSKEGRTEMTVTQKDPGMSKDNKKSKKKSKKSKKKARQGRKGEEVDYQDRDGRVPVNRSNESRDDKNRVLREFGNKRRTRRDDFDGGEWEEIEIDDRLGEDGHHPFFNDFDDRDESRRPRISRSLFARNIGELSKIDGWPASSTAVTEIATSKEAKDERMGRKMTELQVVVDHDSRKQSGWGDSRKNQRLSPLINETVPGESGISNQTSRNERSSQPLMEIAMNTENESQQRNEESDCMILETPHLDQETIFIEDEPSPAIAQIPDSELPMELKQLKKVYHKLLAARVELELVQRRACLPNQSSVEKQRAEEFRSAATEKIYDVRKEFHRVRSKAVNFENKQWHRLGILVNKLKASLETVYVQNVKVALARDTSHCPMARRRQLFVLSKTENESPEALTDDLKIDHLDDLDFKEVQRVGPSCFLTGMTSRGYEIALSSSAVFPVQRLDLCSVAVTWSQFMDSEERPGSPVSCDHEIRERLLFTGAIRVAMAGEKDPPGRVSLIKLNNTRDGPVMLATFQMPETVELLLSIKTRLFCGDQLVAFRRVRAVTAGAIQRENLPLIVKIMDDDGMTPSVNLSDEDVDFAGYEGPGFRVQGLISSLGEQMSREERETNLDSFNYGINSIYRPIKYPDANSCGVYIKTEEEEAPSVDPPVTATMTTVKCTILRDAVPFKTEPLFDAVTSPKPLIGNLNEICPTPYVDANGLVSQSIKTVLVQEAKNPQSQLPLREKLVGHHDYGDIAYLVITMDAEFFSRRAVARYFHRFSELLWCSQGECRRARAGVAIRFKDVEAHKKVAQYNHFIHKKHLDLTPFNSEHNCIGVWLDYH